MSDALHMAIAAHLAHPAMGSFDPMHDQCFDCACAAEGAVPPVTTGAGLTPAQRAALADATTELPHLGKVLVGLVLLGAAASALWPWGTAA